MCFDNQISTSRDTFAQPAEIVMEENNLQLPVTPMEPSVLYRELLFHIESLMSKVTSSSKPNHETFPYFKVGKKTAKWNDSVPQNLFPLK